MPYADQGEVAERLHRLLSYFDLDQYCLWGDEYVICDAEKLRWLRKPAELSLRIIQEGGRMIRTGTSNHVGQWWNAEDKFRASGTLRNALRNRG